MKQLNIALFFVVLAASSAFSQSRQNDAGARLFPDRYGVNGFGARLVVSENPREYVQKWQKPDIPKVNSATDVKRNDPAGVFVVFSGCLQDAQGGCNAEVDYTIYKPDGSVFMESKAQPISNGAISPDLRLGKSFLPFRLGKDEPPGEYKVKAKLSDPSSRISFDLETKFRLK